MFCALLALSALGVLSTVSGFSFNTTTPIQCGQLTVAWDGGEPPFQLLLVPTIEVPSGHIQNISIPTSLTPPYSFTFDLNQPAGLEFIATMYDSTGFGTGGTTPVLTVGSSSNSSCLPSNLLYDFTFSLSPETTPAQCSSQTITWLNNVTRPVNLFGLIPGGTAWRIPIPQDATSYDWQVNVAEGTEYLLAMSDTGPYVTGGSSNLIRVGSGSDTCMNSTSPRSGGNSGTGTATASSPAPSASVSGVGGSSTGGTSNADNADPGRSSGGGSKTGAIVGGAVGGVAFLVLLALLLFCCLRRRTRSRRDSSDPFIRSYGADGAATTEKRRGGTMDLLAGRPGRRAERALSDDSQVETRMRGDEYQPSPFRYPDSAQAAGMRGAAETTPARSGGIGGDLEKASGTPGVLAAAAADRPSFDSDYTAATNTNTGTGTGSGTGMTGGNGATPASAWSDDRTDAATVGNGVRRSSSIAKPPHAQHTVQPAGSPGSGNRPLPTTPTLGGTRFVQHEDSGEVVDLPPRYDQLRARNPDQVE